MQPKTINTMQQTDKAFLEASSYFQNNFHLSGDFCKCRIKEMRCSLVINQIVKRACETLGKGPEWNSQWTSNYLKSPHKYVPNMSHYTGTLSFFKKAFLFIIKKILELQSNDFAQVEMISPVYCRKEETFVQSLPPQRSNWKNVAVLIILHLLVLPHAWLDCYKSR